MEKVLMTFRKTVDSRGAALMPLQSANSLSNSTILRRVHATVLWLCHKFSFACLSRPYSRPYGLCRRARRSAGLSTGFIRRRTPTQRTRQDQHLRTSSRTPISKGGYNSAQQGGYSQNNYQPYNNNQQGYPSEQLSAATLLQSARASRIPCAQLLKSLLSTRGVQEHITMNATYKSYFQSTC